jgi:dolichol-phosphate hexosyltransferase
VTYLQPLCHPTIPATQVIIAALNEAQGIGPTISELQTYLFQPNIIVVDGQSTDGTVEVAKNLRADVYIQNGRGKGNAIAKAIGLLDPTVKYVVITDADFTYPAKHIPDMIRILEKNPDVGMVCGNRFSTRVDKEAVKRIFYIGNKLIALLHSLMNGISLDDPLTGLRVVRVNMLKEWHIKSDGFDIEIELNNEVERRGYDIIEIPIGYRVRVGDKKLRIRDGVKIFSRMFAEALY